MSRADFLLSPGYVTISRLTKTEMMLIDRWTVGRTRFMINNSAIRIWFDARMTKRKLMELLVCELDIGAPEQKMSVLLDISTGAYE